MDTRTPQGKRLVYSYIRLSSGEQMKGHGLARQVALTEEYAASHGHTLSSQTFRDLGVSAYTGKHMRKGGALAEFIGLVERGKVSKGSVLVIEQLDRWSREEPMEAMAWLHKLLKLGIEVVTLADGRSYTRESLGGGGNYGDLFSAMAVLVRAHDESLTKSRRGKDNWRRKRATAATVPLTAMAPGWLTLNPDRTAWGSVKTRWHLLEDRAKVVERVFQLTAEGYGFAAITNLMNSEKVPPPTRRGRKRGTTWHNSTVQKLLSSLAVIGQFQAGHRETLEGGTWRRVLDGDPVPDYYPAIISPSLWLATRKTARPPLPPGRKAAKGDEGSLTNVFTGLLFCSACGKTLHLINKGEGRYGGSYVLCSQARRGLCKATRGWKYEKLEPLLLTLLHRCIRWETIIPTQRQAGASTVRNLEEQRDGVNVQRQTVSLSLQRITAAIEAGANLDTLLERARALEGQRTTLEGQAKEIGERLDGERERLKSITVDVKGSREAFEDWQQSHSGGEKHQGRRGESRHRLATVLRKMLARIVLTSPPIGRGKATEPTRIEVVFRSGREAPETFITSPDLSTVFDAEGELMAKVSGATAEEEKRARQNQQRADTRWASVTAAERSRRMKAVRRSGER